MLRLSLLVLLITNVHATCKNWSDSYMVGTLDKSKVTESSGIAFSKKYSDRLYHLNDGFDRGFFISGWKPEEFNRVRLQRFLPFTRDWFPIDVEDMATGPCFKNESCLFLGDIGNNNRLPLRYIKIAVVRERENFKSVLRPNRVVRAIYPGNKKYDAEAMAVHPKTGDIFIMTKTMPAKLFKLSRSRWEKRGLHWHTLEFVRELDMAKYDRDNIGRNAQVITAMDISPDGERFAILTYRSAIEFSNNFSEFSFIPIDIYPQMEAMAYSPSGRSLIYTSEHNRGETVPVMRINCLDQKP